MLFLRVFIYFGLFLSLQRVLGNDPLKDSSLLGELSENGDIIGEEVLQAVLIVTDVKDIDSSETSTKELINEVNEEDNHGLVEEVLVAPQSVTMIERISLSDLTEEERQSIVFTSKPLKITSKQNFHNSPENAPTIETCTNLTLELQLNDLTKQHQRLQLDHSQNQEQYLELQEKYEQLERNNSLLQIKHKLLNNELQMNELKYDNSKLKFEALTIQLEEKLVYYQKEVQKLTNQLKENQRKYLLNMKQNCSYYCHQQLSNTNPKSSATGVPIDSTANIKNGKDYDDAYNQQIGSGGFGIIDSLILQPILQLFQSFTSFVSVSKVLEKQIDDEFKTNSPPPRSSKESRFSLSSFGSDRIFTLNFIVTLPLTLLDLIYYQYSFIYYLLTQSLPTQYPYLTNNILLPIGSMIYSRLPLSPFYDGYNNLITTLFSNDIMADILNETNFQIYKFFQFLENEDNSTWEFFEHWYHRINEDYFITSSFFQSIKGLLPSTVHSFMNQSLLLSFMVVIGIGIVGYFYRILFGGLLLLLLVLALPWILVVFIVTKTVFFIFYCLDKIFLAPIYYLFGVNKKKTNKKKVRTERSSNADGKLSIAKGEKNLNSSLTYSNSGNSLSSPPDNQIQEKEIDI